MHLDKSVFVDQTLSHDTTGRNGTRGCGVSVACSSANGLGFGVCDEGSDLVSTLGRLLRYHHLHYSEASPLVQCCVDCNHPTGGKDVGEMEMIIFITLLGGLIIVMKDSGGSRAYGKWAIERVRSRKGTEFSAFFMSILFFVDDYFNCLTTSTVLKPLAQSNCISMEKLAFIIHAIANNICLLVPFFELGSRHCVQHQGLRHCGRSLRVHQVHSIQLLPHFDYPLCPSHRDV